MKNFDELQIFSYYIITEPVSSSPPKINALTYKPNIVELNMRTAILCPAQGYPAPSFRLGILNFLFLFQLNKNHSDSFQHKIIKI